MKPGTPRNSKTKGKGGGGDDDLVNQPKITSFFIKTDPNAPRPSNSADLRQTKLLNFVNKPIKKKSSPRKRGRKQKKQKKLVSTKVIPEEDVITIDSSGDSNDAGGAVNGAAEPVAGPSGTRGATNRRLRSNATIHTAETQKIGLNFDDETTDDSDNDSVKTSSVQVSTSQTKKMRLIAPEVNSQKRTQEPNGHEAPKFNHNHEASKVDAGDSDMETQLDDGQEDIQLRVVSASRDDDDSGRGSPSLLTNCNSQLLKFDSSSEAQNTLLVEAVDETELDKTLEIENKDENENEETAKPCQLNQQADKALEDMVDQVVEGIFANNNKDSEADDVKESEKNCPQSQRLVEPDTLVMSPGRCSSSSPETETRGKVFITPMKNLVDPTTPTKSPLNGHTTPSKTVKSKVLKFSPLTHMNSPSKKKKGTPTARAQNSPFKNGIINYFSPAKSSSSNSSNSTSASASTSSASTPKKKFSSLPYYLENFLEILNAVTADDHHAHLFNDDDLALIKAFSSSSVPAQSLFVKLFQRKWTWRPVGTIKYPKIDENLEKHFQALHEKKLLLKLDHESPDKMELDELLQLLAADQINELAKKMGLKPGSKTKDSCVESLLKLTKNQKTLSGSSSDILYKAACEALGETYKVTPEAKRLFSRLFILHSPPQYWEEEADQGSNQLFVSLLTKIGRMQYPLYKISKNIKIYRDRADILRFQDAWTLHAEIQWHSDPKRKDWESGQAVCEQAVDQLRAILSDEQVQQHDRSLPPFLRAYTAGSILSRTISMGIDTYQKTKNYAKANEVISFLLGQNLYSTHYRGRWVERLLVNSKHLKKPSDEMKLMFLNGLGDEFVHSAHKFSLRQKLEKFLSTEAATVAKAKKKNDSANAKLKSRRSTRSRKVFIESSDEEDENEGKENEESEECEEPVAQIDIDLSSSLSLYKLENDIPTRQFEGEKMTREDSRGGKSAFLGSSSTSSPTGNSISSVELFAIEGYRKLGYTNGVHGEGAIPVSLFGLLFWNIVFYDGVLDVFHSPYQPYPLDIHFEEFYDNRRELIDNMLHNLRYSWSLQDAFTVIEGNWQIYNETTSIFPLNTFETVEMVKSLVKSIGLPLVANLCERLCKNFRYYRGGFPDLTLWNSSECVFVEVKGPGDSLSSKQSLWLDYLISVGAKAEVCLVKSVSNKRIRTS